MAVIRHVVPMVAQGGSPVCWAACAMMLMQYKHHRSLNQNELDIGGDLRNSSVAHPGNQYAILQRWGFESKRSSNVTLHLGSEARRARRFARRSVASPSSMDRLPIGYRPPPQLRQTSSEILIAMLEYWGPVILNHNCGAFSYGPGVNTPTAGAHSVLITGVDTNRGVFFFNNPWRQTDVMTSIRSIQGAILRWEANGIDAAFTYLK